MLCNIPFTLLKYKSHIDTTQTGDGIHDLVTFNFAHLPRLYFMLIAVKIVRIRTIKPVLKHFMRKREFNRETTKLLLTISTLILGLHLIACFWVGST
jgi:hypothetical protein